jgi:hypothetical protein
MAQSQPGQIVLETLPQKKKKTKKPLQKRTGGVAQDVDRVQTPELQKNPENTN